MAEYIEREAAIKEIYRFDDYLDDDMIWRLHYALREIPAADVVEVVRCKDCIHAPLPGDCGGSNMEWPKIDGIYEDCTCPHFCDDGWYSARPDPEGFCEKGKRRADNG